ncbi:UCH-domain-containing protein [Eremomyces bilateralis CBS 781.70]|uniref:ubiquitinyl hydrolase 1 n=1 Tax=Eremomyces bilateralis CBS 781.70 TaxID=1392243 RepID=A0A6G1FR52_9PEZI|nr:UCH-domain-containing protein [Eremomyces bilateralis CBS 781.70]KAF1808253.1 UCH-domain-containing protein [Eremomyces bilateralis CBS 781.70]
MAMDPQSVAFTPREDAWRFQTDMHQVRQTQVEHSERLARLERQREDEARLKSLWGSSSAFPSVLGGTPQQVPVQQPHVDVFTDFDDQEANLIGSLHLDADDEPRRLGTTSRANSVRFDESANQGHWSHTQRSSLDLISRTGSGMGTHPMIERTYSHKSDGRQSSAGHSVHSLASGRANSMGLETSAFGLSNPSPVETPGLSPGLFILGSVPSIIRCWLNTNFKHDSLLYAAICTGSYTSFLDVRIIDRLQFRSQITADDEGNQKLKLAVYLPEAITHPASSRSSSPVPQLPSLTVEFTVVDIAGANENPKAIQIFLGSDILRAHNADVLFSTNTLILFDDDRTKLSVPLVRPEDDRTFKSLFTSSGIGHRIRKEVLPDEPPTTDLETNWRTRPDRTGTPLSTTEPTGSPPAPSTASAHNPDLPQPATDIPGLAHRPKLTTLTTQSPSKDRPPTSTTYTPAPSSASLRPPSATSTSASAWTTTSWRRDDASATTSAPPSASASTPPASTSTRTQMDWSTATKSLSGASATPRARDHGIKVLKPVRATSRGFSVSGAAVGGQSRFFEEGKRRGSSEEGEEEGGKGAVVREGGKEKENRGREKGSKVPGITTAPAKKRKLSQPPPEQRPLHDKGPPLSLSDKVVSDTHQTSEAERAKAAPRRSSPRSASKPPTATSTSASRARRSSATPSAPSLPPHMQDEVLDAAIENAAAARQSAAPSDQPTNASSPSSLYANLTLDSQGEMSSSPSENNHDSPPADTNGTEFSSSPPTEHDPRKPSVPRAPRSSSPTKRPASDMEDENDAVPQEEMEFEREKISRPNLRGGEDRRSARSQTEGSDATMQSLPDSSGATTQEASSPDTSVQQTSDERSSGTATPPSIDEQRSIVMGLIGKELKDGQVGYLVAKPWLQRVLSRTSDAKAGEFGKAAVDGEIGPVDNSTLLPEGAWDSNLIDEKGQPFIPIRPDLRMGTDFEVLPEEAFNKIMAWYKVKSTEHILTRYVHDAAPEAEVHNLMYETYPPVFTLTKIGDGDDAKPAPKILASRSMLFITFLMLAKRALDIVFEHKVRVWRRIETLPGVTDAEMGVSVEGPSLPAPESSSNSPETMLIDLKTFNDMAEGTQRELVDVKDESMNKNYNGHLELATIGLQASQVLIFEQTTTGKVERFQSESAKQPRGAGTKSQAQSETGSRRNSPVPQHTARGRPKSKRLQRRKIPGTVGLSNLGNTCFMNSALQCLKSIPELSIYFLRNEYRKELNPDNPIGHSGQMAKSYAELLKQLFESDVPVTPSNFKRVTSKCAPQFSGYQQHDSQELLSFLVDALHEDLNRILKKPYIENPESDDNTVHDPQAVIHLGNQIRSNYAARNDSVIMDLFNGYYKNTMLCPDCEKTSITFDPYSLISLQLPIEQPFQHEIRFVPVSGPVLKLLVDIDRNSSIKQLKIYICNQVGCDDWRRLFIFDVFHGKLYNHLLDNAAIAECGLQPADVLFAYEVEHVPSNFSALPEKGPKKVRSLLGVDGPTEVQEHMLVNVWHKVKGASSSSYHSNTGGCVLWPTLMTLTPEEAQDRDLIYKKCLVKAHQMTTLSMWDEEITSDSTSPGSDDPVITTEEDASSNLDPSIKTSSVEGEDLLEVSNSPETGDSSKQPDTPDTENVPLDSEPAFLKPGEMIPPELQNVFEVLIQRVGGDAALPIGTNAPNDTRGAISLDKRAEMVAKRNAPKHSDPPSDAQSANSSDDELSGQSTQPVATPESEDEDELPPLAPKLLSHKAKGAHRHAQNKKFKNKHGKQARKGKAAQTANSFATQEYELEDSDGGGLIVNNGDFLVCEWSKKCFDVYFGAKRENDAEGRGMDSFDAAPVIEDPEYEEKKARRTRRARKGITLQDCFADSSKTEILSEENVWYCGCCKDNVRAAKTLNVWTLPDILVVHLKRFSSNRDLRNKLGVLVDFPIDGLDLNDFVELKDEGKDYTYDLFGVDNHMGHMGGGHYTAFAKNFINNVWYNYNDSSVSTISENQIVTSSAYLLFYRRRSSAPLGPAYLQQLVHDFHHPQSEDEDEAEDDTRDNSPNPLSGKGKLRAGSSLAGSSRGSRAGSTAAGAGARSRGDGLDSEAATEVDDERMIDVDHHDNGFVDGLFTVEPAPPAYQSTWSFARADKLGNEIDDSGNEAGDGSDDSMVAGGRSPSSDTAATFDDEMQGSYEGATEVFEYADHHSGYEHEHEEHTRIANNSPAPADNTTMVIQELEEYAKEGGQTVEVRVGEGDCVVPTTDAVGKKKEGEKVV